MQLREPGLLPPENLINYRRKGIVIGVSIPPEIEAAGTFAARKHVERFGLLPKTGKWVVDGSMTRSTLRFDTPTKSLMPGDLWIDNDGSGEIQLNGGWIEFKKGELRRGPKGKINFVKTHPDFTLVDGDFRVK